MSNLMRHMAKNKPLIMGIVNVTPDSFSDGGQYNNVEQAIEHGIMLLDQGADILDIGGESTRPGAETVSADEEINRVVPVIEGLKDKAQFISIDTRNAKTMKAAIKAGANIINDVSALTHDPKSIEVTAQSGIPVCLMHMQGKPQDMQNAPKYENVVDEILAYFEERISFCKSHGVLTENIIIDPGIGFGKTLQHNLEIIKNLHKFQALNVPVLLGASRKSFIGMIDGSQDPKGRIGGSLAAAIYGAVQGQAQIIRVHDVHETKQALQVYHAISSSA